MDSNLAPALSVYTESVWGFFFAKFFRLGRTVRPLTLTNLAPALSVYTESVWGFFYAKFFWRGFVIFLTLRGRFTPLNVNMNLEVVRESCVELPLVSFDTLTLTIATPVFWPGPKNQKFSDWSPKRRRSDLVYKSKCL